MDVYKCGNSEEWVFLLWFSVEVSFYLVAYRWQFFVGPPVAAGCVDGLASWMC